MMYSFQKHFMFSSYGLQQGCIWNLFFCHFTHTHLIDYILKSLIVFMFCQNLSMMNGNTFVARTVLLSMFVGSLFLFIHNAILPNSNMGGRHRMQAFGGNDSIMQGLLFTLIFQQPSIKLMLFPLPIQITAYAVAGMILLLDFF